MKRRSNRFARRAAWVLAGLTASGAIAGEARAQFYGAGVYVIRSANTRKVLDVDASWWRDNAPGMPLIQWDFHGGRNQQFRFVEVSPHHYTIQPLHSNQCLEIPSTADGAIIQQAPCNGGVHQRFFVGNFPFVDRTNTISSAQTYKGLSLSSVACRGDAHHGGARVTLCPFPYWDRPVNMQFEFFLVSR